MKRFSLYLFLLLFIFASCHRQKPKTIARIAPATDSVRSQDFYKHFSGHLGENPLTLELVCYNGKYSGYYLNETGVPVELRGSMDSIRHIINLDEIDATSLSNDTLKYSWQLRITADTASGQRINDRDKSSMPVTLKEMYGDGSIALDVFYQSLIGAYNEETDTPYAENATQWLYPKNSDTQKFVVNSIFKIMHCDTVSSFSKESLVNCLDSKAEDYFKEYRETVGLLDESEEDLKNETNNYSSISQLNVVWNANRWLILENQGYDYTGGAHGNTLSTWYCLDLLNNKQWSFPDIITGDTNKLKVLLDISARKYFGLRDNQPLHSRMLVDKVPMPENFFITPGGVVFCYQPYEIASFADGNILLFISYKELDEMLTPAFKERMKIVVNGGGNA